MVALLNTQALKPMVKTLVVILGSVLSFCPEPAPNRRSLTAAEARIKLRFVTGYYPDIANLSARRVYFVVPVGRYFYSA